MGTSLKKQPECDLVMKGGITSGVVYPRAILVLKDHYRFRSIGGGSVGAIAASLTAAAEFGRHEGGFEKLSDEEKKLQTGDFLLDVFRAPEGTRPVLDTLLDLARAADRARKKADKDGDEPGGGTKEARRAVLRNLWPALFRHNRETLVKATLVGVALGVALFFAVAWALASSLGEATLNLYMIVFGLLFGVLFGPLVIVANLVRIVVVKVPKHHFFGLCIGSGEPGTREKPLLTDWLSVTLDDLAGIRGTGPLTYGRLCEGPQRTGKPEDPYVALRMLATNLNHQEPYVFPRDKNTFLFDEGEMRVFFPPYVVEHMIEKGNDVAERVGVDPPPGFCFLPQGGDLPVVVPVRMAVSFPLLLSTVPLHTVRESSWEERRRDARPRLRKEDLQRNLFSDGGICSNFPIHFFDAWLPRRPTFGINLTEVVEPAGPPGKPERASWSAAEIVAGEPSPETDARTGRKAGSTEPWLPRPDEPDSRLWKRVEGLPQFGASILYSARDYRDNMQSRLPSYQERTVQVPLTQSEGGLNLGMESGIIEDLVCRGGVAGEKLLEGFKDAGFEHPTSGCACACC